VFSEDIYNQIKKWAKGGRGGITNSKLQNPKIVAIGEIGLDYHYDNSPREIQKDVFKRQLALAKETAFPVVIHSREAKKDTRDH
jgi:TatD DNase family protein